MRCIKCGFVSFDYLSECRKCGTNLAGARKQLGFSAARPAVPSLLESLLGDYALAAAEKGPVVQTAVSSPFDFEEDNGGGFRQVDEFSAGPGATIPNPDEGEEDFSLLDLSDEELELLIDRDPEGSAQKRPDPWLDLDKKAPEAQGQGPQEQSVTQTKGGEPEDMSDLIPRFDFSSLPGLAERTPSDPPLGAGTSIPAPEAGFEAPSTAPEKITGPPEKAEELSEQAATPSDEIGKPPGEEADDFVIELSETDLENLLNELETTHKKEDEEERENKPPASKD